MYAIYSSGTFNSILAQAGELHHSQFCNAVQPSSREHATDAAEAQKGKSAAADSLPDLPAQPKAAATVGPQSAPADNAGKAGIAVSSALAQQSNVKPP